MLTHDAAWYDRMYDNRALVPDHQRHHDLWTAASRATREALGPRHVQLDLRYGNGEGETLDVFPAGTAGLARVPVLVFLHGGYWRSLDKSDFSFVAPAFLRSGAAVVVPNYALCPGTPARPVTIPHIVLQTVQALAWVWRHAESFGGDPSRIVVAGHSAGGHLGAMLLQCRWLEVAADLPPDLVRRVLSISGLFDLEPIRRTRFLQPTVQLTPGQVAQASPARLPPPVHGHLYAVAGAEESDEFHRQSRQVREAWGAERVPLASALPGLDHFSVMRDLVQPGTALHALALDLVHAA